MLLGGDLVLLYGTVVLVVAWLMARRKWRRAARRREEIRRLMSFASEEAARAELEAAATYRIYASSPAPEPVVVETLPRSSPQLLQYECEVCFSPTTTRCKQCKAVRYCSRKCQVLHWRQGHKDKCHSLTTKQNIDVRVHSSVKEFERDGSSQNTIAIEEMHSVKPVESSSKTCIFSNPNFRELGQNVEMETEACDNRKKTENVKEFVQSIPDDCSSSTISIEMSVASESDLQDCNSKNTEQSTSMDVEATKSPVSEQTSLTNHESGFAAFGVSDQIKFGQSDIDETSESSKLSGFSAAGSEEYSLSESSTPSSDFWAGTVEYIRSKKNAFDGFVDVDMSNNCSSGPSSSSSTNNHVETLGSGMNRVMGDDPYQGISTHKKSIELSKVSEDGLNSRESLSSGCKQLGQCGDNNNSAKCSSTEEAKLSNFDGSCRGTSPGHVPSTSVDVSNLQSLAPKQLDDEIDGTNGVLDTLKRQQNDSSRLESTDSHLSSSQRTRKPAIDVVQSMENGSTHDKATCSLDSSGNVQSTSSQTNLSMRRIVDRASNFPRHGSLSAGSGIMGRYEGSFPYELFVKLYNWNKVELYPCGLMNCGNSCYANAVLQCLAFTPPLAAYCLQGLHAKTCKKREWCFSCEFEELVKKSKECNNPVSPARIMSQMQHIGSHLGNGREEDAHEFLRCAIDAMQTVCLKEAGVNEPSSLFEETTLLGLTFGGYLQSKIECMRCGGKSKQHERIMDLTVEIEGEIGTLEDALLQFTRTEILDGENKYQCGSTHIDYSLQFIAGGVDKGGLYPQLRSQEIDTELIVLFGRCRSYEKAKKKLRVLEAPNVLVVALKRFQTGKFGKLTKSVKFPEILNLAPYMSGTSDKSPIYQLFGVVVHLDVMNAVFSGHYVCYIKNNQGRWFKADDTVVQVVELEKVLSNDAYILFYARCSPRAPRVIRSSMAPRDPRKTKKVTGKVTSHPPEPWDVSFSDHTSNGYFHRKYRSHHRNVEEESSTSEYSSSYFSEGGSHSTESSNRESVSTTDENLEQLLCDTGNSWNRSDFGTSLHKRRSHLDRSCSDAESSSCCSVNTSPSPKRRF